MKRLVSMIICLAMMLSLCGGALAEGETIKIGAILSFTGAASHESALLKQGYDFAAKYWNSQGGIASLGGAQIEMVYADHADDVEIAKTEYERLKSEGCVMMTGDYSGGSVMLAMQPLTERYHIPFVVSQQSALEVYTEGNEWTFNPTNDASTNAQGLVGVVQMIEEKFGDKIDGVGFIVTNTEWGQSQMESFQKYFDEAGIETVYNEVFESGTADFSAQIQKMKAANVKFIVPVIEAFNDAVLLYRQMKEYELHVGFLCCGGVMVTPEFKEAVGDCDGIFSTDTWNPGFLPAKGEEAVAIEQQYQDEYGMRMNENAGCAWNAMAVMVAALEAAGSTDGDALQKALKEMDLPEDSKYMIMTPFEGMKFGYPDNNGNYGHNIYGLSTCSQMIDGEWKMVWPDRLLGDDNPIVWPVN